MLTSAAVDAWAAATATAGTGAPEAAATVEAMRSCGVLGLWEESLLGRWRDRLARTLLPPVTRAASREEGNGDDGDDGDGPDLPEAVAALRAEMATVMADVAQHGDSAPRLTRRVLGLLESEFLDSSQDVSRRRCVARLRDGFDAFSELFELRQEDDALDAAVGAALAGGDLPLSGEVGGGEEAVAVVERLRSLRAFAADLGVLGLLDLLCDSAEFRSLVHGVVCERVGSSCAGVFDEELIAPLERWLDGAVHAWLALMRAAGAGAGGAGKRDAVAERVEPVGMLRATVRRELCRVRTDELFDVIVDFPDSRPAVADLRRCLRDASPADAAALRAYLIRSLKSAFRRRLLHPGANTTDILAQYILAIKALRELDPSGVILEVVCRPVRAYLRVREDTVRSIVRSLVDDSSSELSSELAEGKPIEIPDSDMSSDEEGPGNDDDGGGTGGAWVPDPVDADPSSSRSQRTGDITSLLINIYGSKELFVKEYRLLLSERLLALTDYDVDREARYLELLKLRFGEEHMSQCDVMLKDIADSKRIMTRILEDVAGTDDEAAMEPTGDLRIFILSRLFWPQLKGEDTLELPEAVRGALGVFTERFEKLKAARTLDFKSHLGLVTLELTLDSGDTIEYTVPPVVATIMFHFEEEPRWTLDELSAVMKVPTATVQKRITFWIRSGLIRAVAPGEYLLDEQGYLERSAGAAAGAHDVDDDDDEEEEDEEAELSWQFIQGMLANHPSLPVDRIHTLLSMFIEGGVSLDEQGLQRFLNAKVDAGLLSYAQGEYSLPSD